MILGIDASTYLEELDHNAIYLDGDVRIDPLDAFVKNGVNCMRIRVWNDPKDREGNPYLGGNCDLENYIRLGRLAKAKGYSLMMDLHYSDFWADPHKQMIPKAWANMDVQELAEAVYTFTKECLSAAREADVAPAFIQVGNEITNGMLWPVGKLLDQQGNRGNYETFCSFVEAGCRACREVIPEAKIILHLEKSNDQAVYQEFFTQMERRRSIMTSSVLPTILTGTEPLRSCLPIFVPAVGLVSPLWWWNWVMALLQKPTFWMGKPADW